MMKISSIFLILFFLCASSLKAQLKEFDISEMPRPDVSIVQANTAFPEDALIIVYSSLDDLSFRSSMGAIDKQHYNKVTGRYELLIKPIKQMLFVGKLGFLELKINTLNPNAKDVFYFKVEEKTTALFNQSSPGKLTINSNPVGANISLNGIPVATKTPFTGELNPGRTRIQISKTKYQAFDTVMNIQSSINEVLSINLKPTTLWLNITTNPLAAKVELDGVNIGTTPLSKELDLTDKSKQGVRSLKLSFPDYAAQSQTIQVYPSKDPLVINSELKKLEGLYKIESNPMGAEVFINGIYKGISPLQGVLPIGNYQVELKMDEYKPSYKKEIIVNSQTTASLKENLIPKKKDLENLEDDFEEGTIVKDGSGNAYNTIRIGDQIWMTENLKTSQYSNGELIPFIKGNVEWSKISTGAWCNYNNFSQNDEIYGKLYNWFAVADSRNLCPAGWHVPSDEDWKILIGYLGGDEVAGGKMKNVASLYWQIPHFNVTNESGFLGLPGGYRYHDGTFASIGKAACWWSSSEDVPDKAWNCYLNTNNGTANRLYDRKQGGFSVRCIKD